MSEHSFIVDYVLDILQNHCDNFVKSHDVRVVYIDFYEPTDENNDDDDSFSDYVPVSEQIEPGPVENGKIENDVEVKHENGEKTTEKVGKSQIVKTFR